MGDSPSVKMPKYQVIYADPPWRFAPMGIDPEDVPDEYKSRGAEHHYDTMSLEDICEIPVAKIADRSSVCFMWVTSPFLHHALTVMDRWGFEYKTVAFCWAKQKRDATGWANAGGWYTLSQVELCLIGTRGPTLKRQSRSVGQLIVAPRTEHSAKPEEARRRIEEIYGDVPRIELFARTVRPGWAATGNAVTGLDIRQWIENLERGISMPEPVVPVPDTTGKSGSIDSLEELFGFSDLP